MQQVDRRVRNQIISEGNYEDGRDARKNIPLKGAQGQDATYAIDYHKVLTAGATERFLCVIAKAIELIEKHR